MQDKSDANPTDIAVNVIFYSDFQDNLTPVRAEMLDDQAFRFSRNGLQRFLRRRHTGQTANA